MKRKTERKKASKIAACAMVACTILSLMLSSLIHDPAILTDRKTGGAGETIEWVDFDVPYHVLKAAMDTDIATYDKKIHVDWIDILAYLGSRYGGNFDNYDRHHMDSFVSGVKSGKSVATLTKDMESFSYYREAYGAVLNGFLGEYQIKIPDKATGQSVWKKAYGLKAFSPIAEGFDYSHFDDFGQSRSYGYSRTHLGHDMITATGTPVTAIESGTVEAMGWNQYGGWRLGIRSYDKQRYYYYAHLRKDTPYAENLYIGASVTAGDVIGYTGQTGYSLKENTNNINTPHLHFGMQLIFNEDEKDSPDQIWIDLYAITRLLSSHRSTVVKDDNTGQYSREYPFIEENHYLKEMQASAEMSDADEIQLPIIMYHAILEDNKLSSKYIVSPDLLEKDLAYIRKKGYTPVFMKEVIAFAEGKGKLPERPIVITFDDGYYNNYVYAYPLLQQRGMRAVVSIIGSQTALYTEDGTENAYWSHLRLDRLQEMQDVFEVQNHSWNLHEYGERRGCLRMRGEAEASYESLLREDTEQTQQLITEAGLPAPQCYTYPFGACSEESERILQDMGFLCTLGCEERVNLVTRDAGCLYEMGRFNRAAGESTESYLSRALGE